MRQSSPWTIRTIVSNVLYILIISTFSSCIDDEVGGKEEIIENPKVTVDRPVSYSISDVACQNDDTEVQLQTTTVNEWADLSLVDTQVSLTGFVTRTSLVSPAVLNTVHAQTWRRYCDWDTARGIGCPQDGSGREARFRLMASGKPLRVCRDGHTYKRETVEEMALTSSFFVNRARDLYEDSRQVLNSRKADELAELPKVELNLAPHFVSTYKNYRDSEGVRTLEHYITHNLAYFPAQGTAIKPAIAVFPESKTAHEEGDGNLWESGFVLAHEYGHHIETIVVGNQDPKCPGSVWEPTTHRFENLAPSRPDQSCSLMRSAFAEGWADLIGHYTEENSSDSLIGLPCFGYNRAVDLDEFRDGTEKILTSKVLAAFLYGGRGDDTVDYCSVPRFQDSHIIGAILATALDRMAAVVAPGHEHRYQWMLAVMRSYSRELARSTGTPQGRLDSLAVAVQKGTTLHLTSTGVDGEETGEVKRQICKIFAKRIPAASKAPFANSNGRCD